MHETTSQPPTETTATPPHRPGTADEKRAARAARASTEERARIERQAAHRGAAVDAVGQLVRAVDLVNRRVTEGEPMTEVLSALRAARRAMSGIELSASRDGRPSAPAITINGTTR